MNKRFCIFAILALWFFSGLSGLTITLKQVSTPFNNPNGIDYHQLTNTLILSAYYPTGEPHNFERIEFDGTHVQFSTISGLTREVKIIVVRAGNPGGFSIGDFFCGTGVDGVIAKVRPDETVVNPWVQLPSYVGLMRGSLWVDPWGTTWGGNLVVLTEPGYVYSVTYEGTPTFIAYPGSGVSNPLFEGIITVPDDTNTYGGLSGKILVGSETHSQLIVIDSNYNFNAYGAPINVEDIDYIYPNENFYGVNYGEGRLLGSDYTDWQSVGGGVLATGEWPNYYSSALVHVTWSTASNAPSFKLVNLSPNGINNYDSTYGASITSWEHVTFAAAGIVNIPSPYPVCYVILDQTLGTNFSIAPYPIPNGLSVIGWYGYNSQASPATAYFSGGLPGPSLLSKTLAMFFTVDSNNFISFVIHAGYTGDGGGTLNLELATTGLDSIGGQLEVQDDPSSYSGTIDYPDYFIWSNGQGNFKFHWGATTSDGVAISPISVVGTSRATCFNPTVLSYTNLNIWNVLYWDTTSNTLLTKTIPWDSTPSICTYQCSSNCFLQDNCVGCANNPSCIWCDSNQQCMQNNDPLVSTCGTQYSSTNLCPCDLSNSTCSMCTSNPTGCGWCCTSTGSACLAGTNSGPTGTGPTCNSWAFSTCPTFNCTPACVYGTCVCGRCECLIGYGGDNCNETVGCDGVLGSGKVVDICGVCGGNGTSCIGCNGVPFGLKYDVCGVCGGNGSTCWSKCPFTSCVICNYGEECLWCADSSTGVGQCIDTSNGRTCPSNLSPVPSCSSFKLSVAAAVGISVGIIILIVALIVLCLVLAGVGGKLGYDYMLKHRKGMGGAQSNPLYSSEGREGTNPLYDQS
jgi:hypothetical protein